jgi:hypothetical protein
VVAVAEDVAVQPTATLPPPQKPDDDEQPVAGMAVAISVLALTVSTAALAAVAWEVV